MYSALMLSDLVEARYAARLAEAERRRRLHELSAARTRRLRTAVLRPHLRRPHLPRVRRPRLHAGTSTTCATVR